MQRKTDVQQRVRHSTRFSAAVLAALPFASSAVASPALVTLASFAGTNGSYPEGSVAFDAAGNLYGTTLGQNGGVGEGNVFELPSGSNTILNLGTFTGSNGGHPSMGLINDGHDNLIGTCPGGGANNSGTVFEIFKGASSISSVISMPVADQAPQGMLAIDDAGNLYGTSSSGGPGNLGALFEISATTQTVTNLANFNGNNGSSPISQLVIDSAGNLYGTAQNLGGIGKFGTAFEYSAKNQSISALTAFTGSANGSVPLGGLTPDAAGNLYGTTSQGGPSPGLGTIFEISATTHSLITLGTFNGANGGTPEAPLLIDAAGDLFGTSFRSPGTVFEWSAATQQITAVIAFNSSTGTIPISGLVADQSGNLYGTTANGGILSHGTIFEITNSGFVVSVPEPAAAAFAWMCPAIICGRPLRRRRLQQI